MNDDIDEVKQDPSSLFVSGLSESLEAGLFRLYANLIGDGSSLAVGSAGGDQKIVGSGAFAREVKDGYVAAVAFTGDLRSGKGEVFRLVFLSFCQIYQSRASVWGSETEVYVLLACKLVTVFHFCSLY